MTLRELEALHSNGPISQMIEKKLSKAIESIAYVSQSLENFRENQWEKISHFTKFPTFLGAGRHTGRDDLSPLKTLLGHHPSSPL